MSVRSDMEELAKSMGCTWEELKEKLSCEAPSCDGYMLIRTNRNSGDRFFGCSNFPDCRETRKFDVEIERLTGIFKGEPDYDYEDARGMGDPEY